MVAFVFLFLLFVSCYCSENTLGKSYMAFSVDNMERLSGFTMTKQHTEEWIMQAQEEKALYFSPQITTFGTASICSPIVQIVTLYLGSLAQHFKWRDIDESNQVDESILPFRSKMPSLVKFKDAIPIYGVEISGPPFYLIQSNIPIGIPFNTSSQFVQIAFLPNTVGYAFGLLRIVTAIGTAYQPLTGFGIQSPYLAPPQRVKRLISGETLAMPIKLYNPHNEEIHIESANTAEKYLELHLPEHIEVSAKERETLSISNVQSIKNWTIPARESREILIIKFVANGQSSGYRGFVAIKLFQDVITIPVEVIVLKPDLIQSMATSITLGPISKMGQHEKFQLRLFNIGPSVLNIRQAHINWQSRDTGINVTSTHYTNFVVLPPHQETILADFWLHATSPGEGHGTLVIKATRSYHGETVPKNEISNFPTVLLELPVHAYSIFGELDALVSPDFVNYTSRNKAMDATLDIFTNVLASNSEIRSLQILNKYYKPFHILHAFFNHSRIVVNKVDPSFLKPNETATVSFSIIYPIQKYNSSFGDIPPCLHLFTTLPAVHVLCFRLVDPRPIITCTCDMSLDHHAQDNYVLNLGTFVSTMSGTSPSNISHTLFVRNPTNVPIKIPKITHTLSGVTISLLGIRRVDGSWSVARSKKKKKSKVKKLEFLDSDDTAEFLIHIVQTHTHNGNILLTSDKFAVSMQAKVSYLKGFLSSIPTVVKFIDVSPGMIVSRAVGFRSAFDTSIQILGYETHESLSISSKLSEISPGENENIMDVTLQVLSPANDKSCREQSSCGYKHYESLRSMDELTVYREWEMQEMSWKSWKDHGDTVMMAAVIVMTNAGNFTVPVFVQMKPVEYSSSIISLGTVIVGQEEEQYLSLYNPFRQSIECVIVVGTMSQLCNDQDSKELSVCPDRSAFDFTRFPKTTLLSPLSTSRMGPIIFRPQNSSLSKIPLFILSGSSIQQVWLTGVGGEVKIVTLVDGHPVKSISINYGHIVLTKLFGQFFQLWHAQSEATMLQDKSENLSLENIDWWTSHVDAVLTDATYESLTKDQIIWLEDFTSFQWNASINVTIKNFGNIAALVASPIIGNQICETSHFRVDPCGVHNLNPGESLELAISFRADFSGAEKTTNLVIHSKPLSKSTPDKFITNCLTVQAYIDPKLLNVLRKHQSVSFTEKIIWIVFVIVCGLICIYSVVKYIKLLKTISSIDTNYLKNLVDSSNADFLTSSISYSEMNNMRSTHKKVKNTKQRTMVEESEAATDDSIESEFIQLNENEPLDLTEEQPKISSLNSLANGTFRRKSSSSSSSSREDTHFNAKRVKRKRKKAAMSLIVESKEDFSTEVSTNSNCESGQEVIEANHSRVGISELNVESQILSTGNAPNPPKCSFIHNDRVEDFDSESISVPVFEETTNIDVDLVEPPHINPVYQVLDNHGSESGVAFLSEKHTCGFDLPNNKEANSFKITEFIPANENENTEKIQGNTDGVLIDKNQNTIPLVDTPITDSKELQNINEQNSDAINSVGSLFSQSLFSVSPYQPINSESVDQSIPLGENNARLFTQNEAIESLEKHSGSSFSDSQSDLSAFDTIFRMKNRQPGVIGGNSDAIDSSTHSGSSSLFSYPSLFSPDSFIVQDSSKNILQEDSVNFTQNILPALNPINSNQERKYSPRDHIDDREFSYKMSGSSEHTQRLQEFQQDHLIGSLEPYLSEDIPTSTCEIASPRGNVPVLHTASYISANPSQNVQKMPDMASFHGHYQYRPHPPNVSSDCYASNFAVSNQISYQDFHTSPRCTTFPISHANSAPQTLPINRDANVDGIQLQLPPRLIRSQPLVNYRMYGLQEIPHYRPLASPPTYPPNRPLYKPHPPFYPQSDRFRTNSHISSEARTSRYEISSVVEPTNFFGPNGFFSGGDAYIDETLEEFGSENDNIEE